MIVVFDLDGTICFKGQPVTSDITDILQEMQAAGHRIIIASARPIRDIYPVLPMWMRALDMVGGNGAFVKRGEDMTVRGFDCLPELKAIIEEFELAYLADSKWHYAYTGPARHPIRQQVDSAGLAQQVALEELEEVVKLVLFSTDERVVKRVQALPVELYRHTAEALIDLSPQHVTKWSGLQALGIAPRDFIAFGNDANDVPMFQQAREAICIGMHEEASKRADMCIVPEDVAGYLAEKFLREGQE